MGLTEFAISRLGTFVNRVVPKPQREIEDEFSVIGLVYIDERMKYVEETDRGLLLTIEQLDIVAKSPEGVKGLDLERQPDGRYLLNVRKS